MGLGARVCPNEGCFLGGPKNEDYSILGSILGSPYLGKLPGQGASLRPWCCEAFEFKVGSMDTWDLSFQDLQGR